MPEEFETREEALNSIDILTQIIDDIQAADQLRSLSFYNQKLLLTFIRGDGEDFMATAMADGIRLQSINQQRICFKTTVLALAKFQEWYKLYSRLVNAGDKDIHASLKNLDKELDGRNIKKARDWFVAHIKSNKAGRVLYNSEVFEIVHFVKKNLTMDEYFKWLVSDEPNILQTLRSARDFLMKDYSISYDDIQR